MEEERQRRKNKLKSGRGEAEGTVRAYPMVLYLEKRVHVGSPGSKTEKRCYGNMSDAPQFMAKHLYLEKNTALLAWLWIFMQKQKLERKINMALE